MLSHSCAATAVAALPSPRRRRAINYSSQLAPEKCRKKMQEIPPPKEKLATWIGFARRTKNTSPCAYSLALIGVRLWHHRHTWMAVSHGQYRDRRASNIVQVILVWLAHPLLPLFRWRAPRSNPLLSPPIPCCRRRRRPHAPTLPSRCHCHRRVATATALPC